MFKKIIKFIKKQNNFRFIALGFISVILIGSLFLILPNSIRPNVQLNYIDAIFTSASAICVTGLVSVDVYDTFTIGGQVIILLLIQIGGLGVTTLGTCIALAFKRHISLKERNILQETLNINYARDLFYLFRRIFIYTFIIEFIGFFLSLIFFLRPDIQEFYGYDTKEAFWKSAFHAVSSFNNAGFDILGKFRGFVDGPLTNDVPFNLITTFLIILGGLGFLVINDVVHHFRNLKKTSLHTKIVCLMTLILIVFGTLFIAFTERRRIYAGNFSFLGAFFASVSARTAGFSTYSFRSFTKAGQFIMIILMFIGASPGSTGGGIKTTTFFVLIIAMKSMITHKRSTAFKYEISRETEKKAMVISFLAIGLITIGSILMSINEDFHNDRYTSMSILFETTSALGTVGLSLGITASLSVGNKVLIIFLMFIGRIGTFTAASALFSPEDDNFRYAEGHVPIG